MIRDASQVNLFKELDTRCECLATIDAKYRPVFEMGDERTRQALMKYFLPHRSSQPILRVTRPRIIKWYCPFADQRVFPSGHRYCINVYTGCAHKCTYCYATGYEPASPACKSEFERKLQLDLRDLDAFDVPPAPLHLSNSTDLFQPLEKSLGHARLALQQIARHRHRFTTVVLLTKNPGLATEQAYLDWLKALAVLPSDHPRHDAFAARGLHGLQMEVSLAFWKDEHRKVYDPGAPSIEERKAAIVKLRKAGIPIVLRIDPLLPRDPLPRDRTMASFGLPDAQSLADLEQLVRFARDVGALKIVYSVAKIVQPRFTSMHPTMRKLRATYQHLVHPGPLIYRGGSYRLPVEIEQREIVEPFLKICRMHGQHAIFCKQNLLMTV